MNQRDSYTLINGDFKPDNVRFDKHGNIFLIDFDGIQFFDIECEISQFIIPDFFITNCDDFFSGYFRKGRIEVDETRLLFYKLCRCITQIFRCQRSLKREENRKELLQKIIE